MNKTELLTRLSADTDERLALARVMDKLEAEIRANAHKLMTPQARKAAVAAGRAVDISAEDFDA